MIAEPPPLIHQRLVAALYSEAMLLADEARAYLDGMGKRDRDVLDPVGRVAFSCESLKVTTRLMHVIAWLLTQPAVAIGEISRLDGRPPSRRLGGTPESPDESIMLLPYNARLLVEASIDLHRRVRRLDAAQAEEAAVESPARKMLERLAAGL